MSETGKIDCPICGRSFDAFVVTEHVNRCLSQCESTDKSKTVEKGGSSPSAGVGKASMMQRESQITEQGTFNAKDQKTHKIQQSPPSNFFTNAKTPKRTISNVAGKSSPLPPIKKMKSTEQQSHANVNAVLTPVGGIPQKRSDFKPQQSENNEPHSGYLDEKSKSGPSIRMKGKEFIPLAEKMRPCSLDDYVGQTKVLGSDSLLRSLLQADEIPSMILWGPPGCGKTSLAHIIASKAKASSKSRFVQLSATTSGISDVKEVVRVAKNDQSMFKRKTILFVDEIHRFNKTQQDTFLPHVENGTITLIGATTENPSFQLNNALLSRCRVIVLEKLSSQDIKLILTRALDGMGALIVDENSSLLRNGDTSNSECSVQLLMVEEAAVEALADLCDGDARVALNGLQLAVQSQFALAAQEKQAIKSTVSNKEVLTNGELQSHGNFGSRTIVKVDHIKKGLQRTHLLYDKKGEEHYNSISALHKSIRGNDSNAALYWLARMLEGGEDPLYVARRLVRCASEDIGLADPHALNQAVAAYQACHFIGMPECDVILAQAAVYLARAPKSIEVYSAYSGAKKCVKEWKGPQPPIPLHIRNAPTTLMKNLGYGKDYKYNPAYDEPVDQTYLPPEVEGIDFFTS